MTWFKGKMFIAFMIAFISYIIVLILAKYSKLDKMKKFTDGIVEQLTHQHIIFILVVIILVAMTVFSYLGDFNAEKMLNGTRIQMHIVPKDQNISILDQPLFFVRYANGNYYLSENNRSDGGRKSEIYIIPNSEIKMITMNEIKEATAQPKRTVP
jgi:phosphoglycerol transferase MdoB-like AlkP superfamily enzyme